MDTDEDIVCVLMAKKKGQKRDMKDTNEDIVCNDGQEKAAK